MANSLASAVYRMVWRCGGTYSLIYWRTKEMDIGNLFLSV